MSIQFIASPLGSVWIYILVVVILLLLVVLVVLGMYWQWRKWQKTHTTCYDLPITKVSGIHGTCY